MLILRNYFHSDKLQLVQKEQNSLGLNWETFECEKGIYHMLSACLKWTTEIFHSYCLNDSIQFKSKTGEIYARFVQFFFSFCNSPCCVAIKIK